MFDTDDSEALWRKLQILHDLIAVQFPENMSIKKTKQNIKVWPESIGVILEF